MHTIVGFFNTSMSQKIYNKILVYSHKQLNIYRYDKNFMKQPTTCLTKVSYFFHALMTIILPCFLVWMRSCGRWDGGTVQTWFRRREYRVASPRWTEWNTQWDRTEGDTLWGRLQRESRVHFNIQSCLSSGKLFLIFIIWLSSTLYNCTFCKFEQCLGCLIHTVKWLPRWHSWKQWVSQSV